MVAVSSALIAGFLIMRGGRDAEPTTTRVQSDVSIETEAVAIRNPAEVHSEVVAEPSIQKWQVGSADPSPTPNPSLPTNPDTAISSSAQKVEVGVQNAAFAGWPEAEDSQGSESGQPDGIAQLIEQLNSVQFGTCSFLTWRRAVRLHMGRFLNARFLQDRCYVSM